MNALVERLAAGGVVAIATESSFGLLADPSLPEALDRLVALKPRGADKGMPLILPDRAAWPALVWEIPAPAAALADAFWPGRLSIALLARDGVDARVALDGRVAVRVPGPSPAAELVRAYGRPLTATSANLPGEPPATMASAVEGTFASALAEGTLTVWPEPSPGGLPSTVVVVEKTSAAVARSGAVPREALARVLRAHGVLLDGAGPHR